jgi:hypothetical protein
LQAFAPSEVHVWFRCVKHALGEPCRLVEVQNDLCKSCLDGSLGRVPAYDAGERDRFPAEANLMFVLQFAFLKDRDDSGQVSLYNY